MADTTPTDSAARVAYIEARANAATEGPWTIFNKNSVVAIGVDTDEPHACDKIIHWHGFDSCGVPIQDQRRNAKFIAHARTDIPWLLSELRAAQAQLAACREALRPFAMQTGAELLDHANIALVMLHGPNVAARMGTVGAPTTISIGDLRRAAAALAGMEGQDGE